jgi:sRNA-binding protein
MVPETNLCQPGTGTLPCLERCLQRVPGERFWMHEGVDQLATLYPLCFFREHELRRPLKIGIREDIIAQHPELQPSVIVSALQNYTRCVPYWSTLKAGAAWIDLDGNVAGQVTLEDEQAAKVKIAKAERRAKAREIEDRQRTPAQSLPRQPPSRRR